ncbi:MAG TPA: metallophosphoesterase, partial [Opitutus sp.]|nr:metallophosphoesterase [Opitutus sp.]
EIRPGAWLDARLALWLAGPRTLVVADLHWGYATSHRARGNLLPIWGDEEIAARLHALIADYRPADMIWLGDSLHTLAGRNAAESFLQTATVPIEIVAGNHDAKWNLVSAPAVVMRDGYCLHHGDLPRKVPPDSVEIIGHHHPAATWSDGAGTRLKLPALIVSRRRIVLPAFSPWAAGTPWLASTPDETVYAIGTKRIFTLSPDARQK